MASELSRIDRKTLQQVLEGSLGGLSSVNPVILSCGGIYIPHKGRTQRIIYHILTTANKDTPVKVVTGIKPYNILREVMTKESMN